VALVSIHSLKVVRSLTCNGDRHHYVKQLLAAVCRLDRLDCETTGTAVSGKEWVRRGTLMIVGHKYLRPKSFVKEYKSIKTNMVL
jgi:hypothetical protein